MTEQHWVGCGECDETFGCHDGKDRCIRLPIDGPIDIGEFRLSKHENLPGKVWISHASGEGGSFPLTDIEAIIRDYYNNNF